MPESKQDAILVREWGADAFHARVLEWERKGYRSRLESYRITPEMNPETGIVTHVHSMEMYKPEADATSG